MKTAAEKQEYEKKVVGLMIRLYCNGNHHTVKGRLCPDCRDLTSYTFSRVENCPNIETKTFCSSCKTHCFKADMRERIRTVMRWSGPRMIFHHPVLALRYVFIKLRDSKG